VFVNPEIPPDELPQAQAVDWRPLDPRFVRSAQIKALIVWAVLFAATGALHFLVATFGDEAIGPWPFVIGWAVLASLAICTILWPTISVPRRGYAVRELDLLYKSGVVWQSVKAVPYSRAQHAETNSGPLDRRFGLARLSVFTAGGSGGDLRIVGLAKDVAEGLRAHVLDQLGIAVKDDADGTDA
jgi:hypothetical protein